MWNMKFPCHFPITCERHTRAKLKCMNWKLSANDKETSLCLFMRNDLKRAHVHLNFHEPKTHSHLNAKAPAL